MEGFNKGLFVNTRCAVNGVPEVVWKIKITRNYPKLRNYHEVCDQFDNMAYCRTGHKLHAENYRIHSSNLGLHWVAYSKNIIKLFDQ